MKIVRESVEKKIGLAVIGYKSEAEIPRCIDPFIGHVDTVIYGGGKFDFYDDEEYYDDVDFAEKRYKDKVEFIGYKYSGRQVDKRQKYMDIAGERKLDFLIVMDTDDFIMPEYSDWNKFYTNLVNVSDVVEDRVYYMHIWIPSVKQWSKQGNAFKSNVWCKSAKIFKDPGTMRHCMHSHFMWCDKRISDKKMIQWQMKHREEPNKYQFSARIAIDGVRCSLDRTLRTKEQIKKGKTWARLNQHAENSRQYYLVAEAHGYPAPAGYTWKTWEQKKHTFDKDGRRVEL